MSNVDEFTAGTRDAFSFLYDRGFREVVTENLAQGADHVRFESATGAVDVWHDLRGEVEVFVECFGEDRRFSLNEILSFVQPADVGRYGGTYSSRGDPVGAVLRRLAEGLARYGERWVSCDPAARSELLEFSAVGSTLLTEQASGRARPGTKSLRIRQAWSAKKYDNVIELIAGLTPPLSTGEQLARDYARRRVGGSQM